MSAATSEAATTSPIPSVADLPVQNWALKEASSIVGVSYRLMCSLIDTGKVRTVRIGGRRRLLPHSELVRLLTTGC
jgi:excisionase family DNA binding protein